MNENEKIELNEAAKRILNEFKEKIKNETNKMPGQKDSSIDYHWTSKNKFLSFLQKIVNKFTETSTRNIINKFQNIKTGLQEEKQNNNPKDQKGSFCKP